MIQTGELARDLVRLVERGIDGAGQTDPVGDGRESTQHGERIGPADHIEVVDLPALLAQAQSLCEKQEVEFCPLGGLREMHERAEFDVAAGLRITPHRGVVDTRKVRGQVDLLQRLAHELNPSRVLA